MSYDVKCPLCGQLNSMTQNTERKCSKCSTDLYTDNDGNLRDAVVRHNPVLANLKSLVNRKKRNEAKELLDTMLKRSQGKNYEAMIKVAEDFYKFINS